MRASPLFLFLLLVFLGFFFLGFGGSRGGAAAAGAAAGAEPVKGVVWPFFTIAIGTTLPPCSLKIVISASLRSPFASNCTVPVAPVKLSLKISGVNLAGSVESAFFIASITALVAS